MNKKTLRKWGRNLALSAMLSSYLLSAAVLPAYAANLPEDESGIETHAEQTEWRYRKYNGQRQRRLWSITEGKWLTDWENY